MSIKVYFFLFAILPSLIFSCKTEELLKVTKLQTGTISEISATTAKASATFIDLSGNVTEYGHCWNITENPGIENFKSSMGGIAQKGNYSSQLANLTGNTKYYVKAYAIDGTDVVYGLVVEFTTTEAPYIEIISPVNTDHWIGSETHSIVWNSNFNENISISLYQNDQISKAIANNQPNNGQFDWLLPNDIVYGNDYKIRIISANDSKRYGESENFKVSEVNGSEGAVADIQNNIYNTIKIGKQWWMKENLKTSRFNDNGTMDYITDYTVWRTLQTPAYCFYNHLTENKEVYGNLYNWFAIETGLLCPVGWHVPSQQEWLELEVHLGGYLFAGNKMKETGIDHWIEPNSDATNSSGFTALPSGLRYGGDGQFWGMTELSTFWSATAVDTQAWIFEVEGWSSQLVKELLDKKFGSSIRCVKD